jgi:hypothetical protein
VGFEPGVSEGLGTWGTEVGDISKRIRRREDSMVRMVHRSAISVLKLGVAVLVAGSATFASRAAAQNVAPLQPQGLSWAGIRALRGLDPSLTGAGVRIGVVCRSFTYEQDEPQYDYRPNVNHTCFQNAKLRFYDDGTVVAGVSPHETAVCSILFGDDPLGTAAGVDPFAYRGATPAAEGQIYELQHFVAQHVFTQNAPEIDLLTASFGTPLEAWWTRGIESLAEHEGLTVVASIGNGSNASDPPLYPGAGSNAIGVGVMSSVSSDDPATNLANFALAYPEQSSRGPTDDERCKPDLVAPGNCLVAQADSDRGYAASGTWSSFSAPVVAGVAGLLIQTAKQDKRFDGILSGEGANCLLKAILMNSATKLPFWHKGRLAAADDHEEPLDYTQGAGMVNAVAAHQLLTAGQSDPGAVSTAGWDLNRIEQSRDLQQLYRMTVEEPANKMLTATLVWNRHYSREYPFKRISDSDSNLRLEVWAVDPQNPANDLLLDYSDSRVDNVEHVYVETVAGYSSYVIVVSFSNVNDRTSAVTSERYAVAWSVDEKPGDENILWYDLNADGVVNEQDLAVLTNGMAGQTSSEAYVLGDINSNGAIDDSDVKAVEAHRDLKADWYVENAGK